MNCIIIVIGYMYFRKEEQRLYSGRSGRSDQVSIHFKNYLHSRERRTPNRVLQILPLPHFKRSQPLLLPMSYNITRSFIMIFHRLKGTLGAEVTKCYISPWDKIKRNFLDFRLFLKKFDWYNVFPKSIHFGEKIQETHKANHSLNSNKSVHKC
jgi:hypothetical protein